MQTVHITAIYFLLRDASSLSSQFYIFLLYYCYVSLEEVSEPNIHIRAIFQAKGAQDHLNIFPEIFTRPRALRESFTLDTLLLSFQHKNIFFSLNSFPRASRGLILYTGECIARNGCYRETPIPFPFLTSSPEFPPSFRDALELSAPFLNFSCLKIRL